MSISFEDLNFGNVTVHHAVHRNGFFSVNPRPYAALSLRTKGRGVFRVGGKQFASEVGDVLFLPANLPYEVQYSVSECIVIHLLDCDCCECENFHCRSLSAVESYFSQILDSWNCNCSLPLIKSHVYGLLDLLLQEQKQRSRASELSRCVAYMEHHFQESDFNVETLCRETFVSRSTLQREFRQHFGVSPHQYLTHLRLSHALNLLTEGKKNVKQTALECGFSDEKYFSRAFFREYQCLPSQMRLKE